MGTWASPPPGPPLSFDQILAEATRLEAAGIVGDYATYGFSAEFQDLAAARVDLQDQGGARVIPSAAAPVVIASTSGDDSVAGTGARVVLVSGLGDGLVSGHSGPWLTEAVALNGVSDVATTNNFLRVNHIVVIDAGSVGQNVGTIDASTSGNLQVRISVDPTGVGNGISRSSHTAMPADWYGLVREAQIGWSGNSPMNLFLGFARGPVTLWPISHQITMEGTISFGLFLFPSSSRLHGQVSSGGGTKPVDLQATIALVRA